MRTVLSLPPEYAHLIEGRKLSGALQRDILFLISSATEDQEWATLPLAKIAEICCTDTGGVSKAIADMVNRGLISRRQRSEGERHKRYEYRLMPDLWKAAPVYTPPTR